MGLMHRFMLAPLGALLALALALGGDALAQDTQGRLARLAALQTRLTSLEQQVQLLEDSKAIKRLQRAYGYYLDKGLGEELVGLFSQDPSTSVEYGNRGVYVGPQRIEQYLLRLVGTSLPQGRLNNHIIVQGAVHVAPDGRTAKGRWFGLIQLGEYGKSATWSEGIYENEYVKEDGVWKFSKVHWYTTVTAPYDPGWHLAPQPMPGVDEDFPPDRPPSEQYQSYPEPFLPPFHYANPVSGRCEEGSCNE